MTVSVICLILFSVICLVSLFQSIVWICIVIFKNPGIVDVAWSIGLWLIAFLYAFYFQTEWFFSMSGWTSSSFLLMTFLTVWMLRLAVYLLRTRILVGHRDKRYMAMYDKWGHNALWMMWLSCQFQGLCQIVLSISFVFVFLSYSFSIWISVVAGLVFLIGIIGESIADYQLQQFKKHNSKKTAFCQQGLWKYSRHPNYFFEILVWVGIALLGVTVKFGYIACLGPLFLYCLMTFMSGPITEKSTAARCGKAYQDYQESTPMIIPRLF